MTLQRPHSGQRRTDVRAAPHRSVFINCPFDQEYETLFDAIVFAITACGFTPRCALESGSVSTPRMEQIFRALNSSKYSIHDLTRCRGEGDENLARFNMPLEFGIAFGKWHDSRDSRMPHDWLVLLPADHYYKRCVSDLGGNDPRTHMSTVQSIVPPVMSWLATRPDVPGRTPTAQQVIEKMPRFDEAIKALRQEWSNNPPWGDVLDAALKVAKDARFVPRGHAL